MNCKKCNLPVNDNDIYCGSCGTKIDRSETLTTPTSKNIDDVLLDLYIGKNSDKIKSGSFSLPAFFLGALYFLYRKMWLYGIAYIVISLIVTVFIPDFSNLFSLILSIAAGVSFNKLYVKHAKEKIRKIKEDNYDKQNFQLEDICIKKGGTSLGKTILFVVLYFLGAFMIGFIYGLGLAAGEIEGNIKSLEYEISSLFTENAASTDDKKIYMLSTSGNTCTINITTTPMYYYEDINDYLDTTFYVSDKFEKTELTKKIIDGEFWYTQEVKNNGIIYYYATEKNGYIYYININIQNDDGICDEAKENFIDSLDFD